MDLRLTNNIRVARKAKGLTMKELGKRVDAAESTISQYENSKRQPDNEMLLKLAEELDTTVGYLLGAETQKEPAASMGDELSSEQRALMNLYDSLGPADRAALLASAKALAETRKAQDEL